MAETGRSDDDGGDLLARLAREVDEVIGLILRPVGPVTDKPSPSDTRQAGPSVSGLLGRPPTDMARR